MPVLKVEDSQGEGFEGSAEDHQRTRQSYDASGASVTLAVTSVVWAEAMRWLSQSGALSPWRVMASWKAAWRSPRADGGGSAQPKRGCGTSMPSAVPSVYLHPPKARL